MQQLYILLLSYALSPPGMDLIVKAKQMSTMQLQAISVAVMCRRCL